ncbi:DUF560 domain-containing protein [Altericroceibacterium spongiae]|uniref:DUF560 domain-containing protein n=1 Tax=Altericroceibacterium spongiae TaxID=2320269 RepID=A0A420EP41_9SPHN|nr:surface lipoprotein assembly modifier [Altericroceibacterium spongiae]RKF22442.1 DUF560 domain-containing protein [Altericroceibacterium spongiae]UBS33730.1 surface lipoprotein assembly modifier [Altererythrobacter sp. N1]
MALFSILLFGAASASGAGAAPDELPPTTASLPLSELQCADAAPCETVSPARLFAFAERLVKVGRLDAAEQVLRALIANRNLNVRSEARFRLGNLLANSGDLEGASKTYRRLLDEKPDATPVRLELARVLALSGHEDAARRQLERASSAGLPDDVAALVDRYSLALRSRQKFGGGFQLGFAPDSNINRATSDSTVSVGSVPVELDEDAQAQSGLGVTLAGNAFLRIPLTDDANLLTNLSAGANIYGESQFNDISTSISIGPELLRGRSRFRPQLVASKRWFGNRAYSTSYGGRLNWRRQLDASSQAELDAIVLRYDYDQNDGLDGYLVSGVLHYERALSSRLYGRLGFRIDRQDTRDPAYATWTVGADMLLSREIGRQSIFTLLSYHRISADAAFQLPPTRRDDKLFEASGGILLRSLSFNGLAPAVRLRWTQSHSPVFFYDYSRLRAEISLTRDF